jgi:hypothetical protein
VHNHAVQDLTLVEFLAIAGKYLSGWVVRETSEDFNSHASLE